MSESLIPNWSLDKRMPGTSYGTVLCFSLVLLGVTALVTTMSVWPTPVIRQPDVSNSAMSIPWSPPMRTVLSSITSIDEHSSVVTQFDNYMTVVMAMVSTYNQNLWTCENMTRTESPFIYSNHPAGMEQVMNLTSPTDRYMFNLTNTGSTAVIPDITGGIGVIYDITYIQCTTICVNTMNCIALQYVIFTTQPAITCTLFGIGYQNTTLSYPSGTILYLQGAILPAAVPPSEVDNIQNGLRSGGWLGGVGTGGYELRADGTFYLSTYRNQNPAGEPWQGLVPDFIMALAINQQSYVVRLAPLAGITNVPQIVYSSFFPLTKLNFLNVTLYAYSLLTPGNSNLSNTPAVVFELEVTNYQSIPMNVSFMIVKAMGLRSYWDGLSNGLTPIINITSHSQCASKCLSDTCYAWGYVASLNLCFVDTIAYAEGSYQQYNGADIDTGNPGNFTFTSQSVTFNTTTVPAATSLLNAIGSEMLYAVESSTTSVGTGASSSISSLLSLLNTDNPAVALSSTFSTSSSASSSSQDGLLYAGACITALNIQPNQTISLPIYHIWYYPILYWYKNAGNLINYGVRYTSTYSSINEIPKAINLTQTHLNLYNYLNNIYNDFPYIIQDNLFNSFTHIRSSIWLHNGEYRQWENLGFTDFGDPTNDNERNLPYIINIPETMRSQLLIWKEYGQSNNGAFYCVFNTQGTAVYGNGDPCGLMNHPDDISVIIYLTYILYTWNNDTDLLNIMYPSLLKAFNFYIINYNNSNIWNLPYQVHETYDVPYLTSKIEGGGNLGYSLFNNLHYLMGLYCLQEFSLIKNDNFTTNQINNLIKIATNSIENNFWSNFSYMYIGDTINTNYITSETNGFPIHTSDDLRAQVLAYNIGLSDLLPKRIRLKLHSNYIYHDLMTKYGLQWSNADFNNWFVGDHSLSALMLWWHEDDPFNTTLTQLNWLRIQRQEVNRPPATYDTKYGQPSLLNYYGYMLFFHQTITAYTGRIVSLPKRTLSFNPHPIAFYNKTNNITKLPLQLAGTLGVVTISDRAVSIQILFWNEDRGEKILSFLSIYICNYSLGAYTFTPQQSIMEIEWANNPCLINKVTSIVKNNYCIAQPPLTSLVNPIVNVPITEYIQSMTLAECQTYAVVHHYCAYGWYETYQSMTSVCVPIPGVYCIFSNSTNIENTWTVGYIQCDYTSAIPSTNISFIQLAEQVYNGVSFANGFEPINSYAYSIPMSTALQCQILAQNQSMCGWWFVDNYANQPTLGGCSSLYTYSCCFLNPYYNCQNQLSLIPFDQWGNSIVGILSTVPGKITPPINYVNTYLDGLINHFPLINNYTDVQGMSIASVVDTSTSCPPLFTTTSLPNGSSASVWLNRCPTSDQGIVITKTVLQASYTLSVWVKWTDFLAGGNMIFGGVYEGGNQHGILYVTTPTNTTIQAVIGLSYIVNVATIPIIKEQIWYHFTITCQLTPLDGSPTTGVATFYLYINGIAVAGPVSLTIRTPFGYYPTIIGGDGYDHNIPFDIIGYLYNLRIHDIALSSDEIIQMYKNDL